MGRVGRLTEIGRKGIVMKGKEEGRLGRKTYAIADFIRGRYVEMQDGNHLLVNI